MPGHFDGPAPTIAPTLYDEDLPWLGFHFDTKQVMFKKIDDDTSKMPTRMAPSKSWIKLHYLTRKCQISPPIIERLMILDLNARYQYLTKKVKSCHTVKFDLINAKSLHNGRTQT